MKDLSKIVAVSLLSLVMSFGGFSLAYSAIEQGYVVVGKHTATTYYRADDPIAFYLCFAGMFVFGLIGIAGAIIPFFVPREKKESYMTYVDSNIFHVRKSIRWLALVLFCFVALIAFVLLAAR